MDYTICDYSLWAHILGWRQLWVFGGMGRNYTIKILGDEPVDENVMLLIIIGGMIFITVFIGEKS